MTEDSQPKHLIIFETLRDEILEGKHSLGRRFPSEQQLVSRFGFSRPTVSRALRDLKSAGLIDRRPGSGTYLRPSVSAPNRYFGMIVPSLGTTEIFTPICNSIASQSQQAGFALILGNMDAVDPVMRAKQSLDLCRQYIQQKVAGVFLEPLEIIPEYESVNEELLMRFSKSNIPVVLLDRDIVNFPERSPYDLVGIDNMSAGFRVAEYLIKKGSKRIFFVARPGSASTVQYRIAGIGDAMLRSGLAWSNKHVLIGDPQNSAFTKKIVSLKPDALICANDATAAHVIASLAELKISIPKAFRLASFDDVQYAKVLTPALTTIHQPCAELGVIAVQTLLQRIENPQIPVREIMLHAPLVIRKSA